jgi:hypothetical protein
MTLTLTHMSVIFTSTRLQEVEIAEELHCVGPALCHSQVKGQPPYGEHMLAEEFRALRSKHNASRLLPLATCSEHQVICNVMVDFSRDLLV